MTTVVERLIESWLDSQTERRYQPAFIQLLVSEGWTVLHNTRHSPIELGKDVIARDPQGVLHCFQLKGNPAGRITKNEAQGLLGQIVELLEVPCPIIYRRTPNERHVAVFVTNGEIDEEARLVFEGVRERTATAFCPAERLDVWSRGALILKFLATAGKIWPTSVEGTRHVLNLIARDGREIPDPKALSVAFASTAPDPKANTSGAARTAHLTSLLLLAEIIKAPLYQYENHYGLFVVSVLVSVHALRFANSATRIRLVAQYSELCVEHCGDLVREAIERRFNPDFVWAASDVLSEFDVMWERRRLVADCAAVIILKGSADSRQDYDYLVRLIDSTVRSPRLWGQGAVPSLIVRYWALTHVRADAKVDQIISRHLATILEACLGRLTGSQPLPSPYYNFTDCWAYWHEIEHLADDGIHTDSFRRRTWFCKAILFMLAKRNLKQTCKTIWPTFSEAVHEEVSLRYSAFFDARLSQEGTTLNHTFHHMDWRELVRQAVDDSRTEDLKPFDSLAWLIAAYIGLVPYRAWTDVLMWLDSHLNTTWYRKGYLPTD